MSLYDYELSKKLNELDPTFAALIMAAARKADTVNFAKLADAFPHITYELIGRYNAAEGKLSGEADV